MHRGSVQVTALHEQQCYFAAFKMLSEEMVLTEKPRRKSSSYKDGRWITWSFNAKRFQFTGLLLVIFWSCVEDSTMQFVLKSRRSC